MDDTILRLAAYAHALAFDHLDADAVQQTKRRGSGTLHRLAEEVFPKARQGL